MIELAGAPPPLLRRPMGALLLVAPPLRVANLPRVPPSQSCDASCSAARAALTSRTPWPVGAPTFILRLLSGAVLPISLPLPVDFLLCVPYFLVSVPPLAPAARGALLLPMLGPMGAPPPFGRLLVDALLSLAPPLLVALLFCVWSFNVSLVLVARLRLNPRNHLFLGLWVLLHRLRAARWALCCLVLRRSRWLLNSVRRPSWVLRCFVLWCWWGYADSYAWARGRSSAVCATTRRHFPAYCSGWLVAPMLRAVGSSVALLRLDMPFVGLPFCLWRGSCMLRCPWALRYLLSYRSRALHQPCPISLGGRFASGLWASAVAFACGCLTAPRATAHVTARGRFEACGCDTFVCPSDVCHI